MSFQESSFQKSISENGIEDKAEKEKTPWDTKIILQRHGEFYNQKPGDPEFEKLEKEGKLGLLTEKGIEETKKVTKKKLSKILESGKPSDVVFLYSPTEWLDWKSEQGWEEGYGSRGKHTNKAILDTIASELEERTELGEKIKGKVRITGIGPEDKLRELNIFYIYNAQNPRAYIETLREKFGKEDWWEEYYNIAKDIESLREETGVIWMITHKEIVRSYLQHGLKAEEKDVKGYEPEHNESLDINITSNGKIVTEFKDKEYKINFENENKN